MAFVDGITAAAVGAITGSVIVIAKRSIVDIPTAVIALVTEIQEIAGTIVNAVAAVLGLVLYPLVRG